MTRRRNWLFAGIMLLSGNLFAQQSPQEQLQKDRGGMIDQLNIIERNFNQVRSVSRDAMMQLTTINRNIENQERYIISISKQPNHLSIEEMQTATREISRVKSTVDKLRNYYYHPETIPKATANTRPPQQQQTQTYTPQKPTYTPIGPQHHQTFPVSNAALTGDFGLYRGQIPYPIDKGSITQGFGRYKIEGSGPDIVGDNPGITLSTPVGTPVKAVFEGDVVSVSKLGGTFYVVVRHGRYVTAYSNLGSAAVTKGAKIKARQIIGAVGLDDENGYGKLDFLLMFEDKNLDPRAWLIQQQYTQPQQ